MKKIKNVLFVFIALFMFVGVVDAVETNNLYTQKWKKTIATDADEGFIGGIGIENDTVVLGQVYDDYDYGFIARYDNDGNLVWKSDYKIDDTDIYLFGIFKTNNYIIVLGYNKDTNVYFYAKYSFDGKLVETKDIETGLSGYNDIVVYGDYYILVADEFLELYNVSDNTLVGKVENLYAASVSMNSDGIYAIYADSETGHMTVAKYNYKCELEKKNVIVEAVYDEETEEWSNLYFDYELVVAKDTIYAVVDEYYLISVDKANLTLNKMIDLPDNSEINGIAYTNDNLVLNIWYDSCSTEVEEDTSEETEASINLHDVKAACMESDYDNVIIYDKNLNEVFREEIKFYVYELINNSNGFTVGGEYYASVDEFNNASEYDVYVYRYLDYSAVNVEIAETTNGTVTSEEVINSDGTITVKLTITPADGYTIKTINVKTVDGEEIEVKDNSFVKPDTDVVVDVEFELLPVNPNTGLSNPFMICGIALAGAGITYCFLKKKKYI